MNAMDDQPDGREPQPASLRKRDLARAIREARVAQSARSDVIVDLRAAEIARLEQLSEDVAAVLDQVPEAHLDMFDGGLVPGFPPRLWLDMLTFVEMGRDRRTFRLVRDSRAGRAILAESPDASVIIDKVTEYVAHRVVERERVMASDTVFPAVPAAPSVALALPAANVPAPAPAPVPDQAVLPPRPPAAPIEAQVTPVWARPDYDHEDRAPRVADGRWVPFAFLSGSLTGVLILAAMMWALLSLGIAPS